MRAVCTLFALTSLAACGGGGGAADAGADAEAAGYPDGCACFDAQPLDAAPRPQTITVLNANGTSLVSFHGTRHRQRRAVRDHRRQPDEPERGHRARRGRARERLRRDAARDPRLPAGLERQRRARAHDRRTERAREHREFRRDRGRAPTGRSTPPPSSRAARRAARRSTSSRPARTATSRPRARSAARARR